MSAKRAYALANVLLLVLVLLVLLLLLLVPACVCVCVDQSSVSPRGMPPPMSPSQRAVGVDPGSSLREFVNTGGLRAYGVGTATAGRQAARGARDGHVHYTLFVSS
jgi:hypothetical protein